MSSLDTPSGAQLVQGWEGEAPAFFGWMQLTMLVMMVILPI